MHARPATTVRFEFRITSSMIHEGELIKPKRRPPLQRIETIAEYGGDGQGLTR
jgi:hypothetical protein